MTINWSFPYHPFVKMRWIMQSLPACVIMHDFLLSADFLDKHFFPKKEESFQTMQSLSNSLDSKSGPTFCHS